MLSGRRDRPPSGRHNARDVLEMNQERESFPKASARPQSARVIRTPSPRADRDSDAAASSAQPSDTRRMNRPMSAKVYSQNSPKVSAREDPQNWNKTPQQTKKFDVSANILADEMVQRLHDKIELEKKAAEAERTRLLGKYNAFSRPKASMRYPLRSSLLDPEVNNYPPSKTRTELMRKIKVSTIPHPSYDIDGDGSVSQEDYKLSKRFDFDGNGVIDPDEREVAKHVIAEEFFRNNSDHLNAFGEQFAQNSVIENTINLESAHCFERTLRHLKSIEEGYRSRSSKQMSSCMKNETNQMKQLHYYNDKSDTAAYTDFDGIPRRAGNNLMSIVGSGSTWTEGGSGIFQRTLPSYGNSIAEHQGSRRQLVLARKEMARQQAASSFNSATSNLVSYRNQRVALISNFEVEN